MTCQGGVLQKVVSDSMAATAMTHSQGQDTGCIRCLASSGPGLSLEDVWFARAMSSDYVRLQKELADLKRQQRVQAESLLMLVHELRSPVAASKSLAAAMRYVGQQDPQVVRVLARIETRMGHLLELVNDILDLAQVKAGHPLGEVRELDLVSETEAACRPFLDHATAKGLQMTIDLPEVAIPVRLVPLVYHLILSNLVSNAIKYTPAGSIHLDLSRNGSCVQLQVTDTGIGIPSDDLPRLFAEFFRASNARKSQVPGSGLGLASVKALVERCGGELLVESQENEGSCFTVRLPLESRR